MPKKLTMQDIARIAEVAKATISRVLYRNLTINYVLSERVRCVVQAYDFVPNVAAASLVVRASSGRSRPLSISP